MTDKALGMIETRGLIASIEAADAMMKAAKVRLLGKEKITAGLVTILIVGETAAVKSAVEAGAAAAKRVGEVVSTHIIPRPDDQVSDVVEGINAIKIVETRKQIEIVPEKKIAGKRGRPKKEIELFEEETIPAFKTTSASTIDRLKKEALGKSPSTIKTPRQKTTTKLDFTIEELEVMNVHQLRRFARGVEIFPIKGREISRANRGELLDYFKTLLK